MQDLQSHLKTSGAAHLFAAALVTVSLGRDPICTLWFLHPVVLTFTPGLSRFCQTTSVCCALRQAGPCLPSTARALGSFERQPASLREELTDWEEGQDISNKVHRALQAPCRTAWSPPLLHREGRKLTQIYAFNQKEINGKETKWQHILLSVHLEKKLICSTCVRGERPSFPN